MEKPDHGVYITKKKGESHFSSLIMDIVCNMPLYTIRTSDVDGYDLY